MTTEAKDSTMELEAALDRVDEALEAPEAVRVLGGAVARLDGILGRARAKNRLLAVVEAVDIERNSLVTLATALSAKLRGYRLRGVVLRDGGSGLVLYEEREPPEGALPFTVEWPLEAHHGDHRDVHRRVAEWLRADSSTTATTFQR